MSDVTVIDYGMGNLYSVSRAFEHCGANVHVTSDPDDISSATRLVLPGVGAFAVAMAELKKRGFDSVVQKIANKGIPLLGICLGMQMLMDESEEFKTSAGLGLIHGRVVPIPLVDSEGLPQNVPHIGWSPLGLTNTEIDKNSGLMDSVSPRDAVYFVHSYMVEPDNINYRIANVNFGGTPVAAIIKHNNIIGCQFHPEKSGEVGLTILRNFLKM